MKVVFDTNIFIAALVFPGGSGEQAVLRVTEGLDSLVVSHALVGELLEALARKFGREREELARVAVFVAEIGDLITPSTRISILTDEADNRVLECAVAGGADLIVTGDKRMLELGQYGEIRIISLSEYLETGGAAPPLVGRAARFSPRPAILAGGHSHDFSDLRDVSARRMAGLLRGNDDLAEARIGYLLLPGFDHVATQWAIWRAGGVAVPLAPSHPAPELAWIIADARPAALIIAPELRDRAAEALNEAAALVRADGDTSFAPDTVDVLTSAELEDRGDAARAATPPGSEILPSIDPARRALIVYTSGTTGRPKGAVSTHANLAAQITTLVDAWEWSEHDRILHVLPMHHVHGIVNALCCALWAGACCEFCEPEPQRMWERLASGEVTVFMAVPTIYRRLIDAWEAGAKGEQRRWSAGASRLRLMVSGSAALPVETLQRWEHITGHRLLERYGMTEIGMALGNPLHGERRPGTVGQPFAGVEARVVDSGGDEVAAGEQGEIEARGAQLFLEYWNRPDETATAFTADGWFRTGDEGVVEDGYWRILGRRGVDIIKTGGYKVSALEIEAVLRRHPAVSDAAVLGLPDEEWGERVCAAVTTVPETEATGADLRAWCKEQMAPYKVPKQVEILARLPRNAMGKVTKPALHTLFFDPDP